MVPGAGVASMEHMSILTFIIIGIVAGFLARAIMPGRQSMGFLATALLGMVGSFVGGTIGNLLSGEHLLQMNSAGIIGSVLGSLLVLFIVVTVGRRHSHA